MAPERRSRPSLLAILLAVCAIAGVAAWSVVRFGVLDQDSSASPTYAEQLDLTEFEEFDGFSLYWLGDEFVGLPLGAMFSTRVENAPWHEGDPEGHDVFLAVYGQCSAELGSIGCAAPLGINIQPYCARPPENFPDARGQTVRGAIVKTIGSDPIVWTSDAAISVSGTDPAVVEAAIEHLVALTPGGPRTPEEDLGPPTISRCP